MMKTFDLYLLQQYEPSKINILGGDKVSKLTHTYPHESLSKIKVAICNHQAD